jgi:hypothetical protein
MLRAPECRRRATEWSPIIAGIPLSLSPGRRRGREVPYNRVSAGLVRMACAFHLLGPPCQH